MSRNLKTGLTIMLAAAAMVSVTSCSNDDDTEEEAVLHQNYIQGKLNNHVIAMDDINANIPMDKSDYEFSSGNQSDIPAWFDWNVKLVETKDSVVTLYLHIEDVKRTNDMIYSPNDKDPIKTKSTCYATVSDLKNNTTCIYHPTHSAPVDVWWNTFMLTVGSKFEKPAKVYDYEINYTGHRWPGIEGHLNGTLTSDDASKSPLNINMKFILY